MTSTTQYLGLKPINEKLIFTIVTTFAIIKIMGCSPKSNPESTIKVDPNLEQKANESQQPEPVSQVNLQNYDETVNGIPVMTKYPDTIDVNSTGSGEGVGIFFEFKPQGNALDQAAVHFFFPTGAKTATEVESFAVDDSNGLMANNGWTQVREATPPQDLIYPWVKKIITFSAPQKMMGQILLGETNGQGLRVTLLYPAEMADAYWFSVKPLLDNVEFEANLLPIESSEAVLEEASNSNRAAYQELPLPSDANLVGTDAKQIALNIFGITEPVEGNFQEEVSLEKQSDNRVIVNLTQTGLPDNSVEGTRYRLEFIRDNVQWRLDWVGRQVRCYPERGSQLWSKERCR